MKRPRALLLILFSMNNEMEFEEFHSLKKQNKMKKNNKKNTLEKKTKKKSIEFLIFRILLL